MYEKKHVGFTTLRGYKESKFNFSVDHEILEELYGVCVGDNTDGIIYSMEDNGTVSISKNVVFGDGCLADINYGCGEHFMNGNGMCLTSSVPWEDQYE